jgi:opacity protein-like surface antigen
MNRSLRLAAVLLAFSGATLHAQTFAAPDGASFFRAANDASVTQPPPRRGRYGNPHRRDHFHNADGSAKYELAFALGLDAPAGNAHHYLIPNYAFQIGGGRNFNRHFGILFQYDYDRFGFNAKTLAQQLSIYDIGISDPSSPYYISSLNGNTHIWSLTLDPHYYFPPAGPWTPYVVAGAGFFHKVANFTTPATGAAYSPYLGYYQYATNEVIDKYTSNAPGFNGGFGVTYKPSRFASERLFAEARYNATVNSQRTGITAANINTPYGQAYTGSDFYPANSDRTGWLALKIGVRF